MAKAGTIRVWKSLGGCSIQVNADTKILYHYKGKMRAGTTATIQSDGILDVDLTTILDMIIDKAREGK